MNALKKLFVSAILTVLISSVLLAQEKKEEDNSPFKRPTNSFSINSFDGATLLSINYERVFARRLTSFFAIGFGYGYAGDFKEAGINPNKKYRTFSHHLTYSSGKKNHFLEFGITACYIPDNEETNYQLGPLLGYRIQPLSSARLNARLYASVPFFKTNPDMFYSPVGMSIGFCF